MRIKITYLQLLVIGTFAFFLNSTLFAQAKLGDLNVDQTATDAIRAATTAPEYLTQWVGSLPQSDSVPSPRDVLGYTIGTPSELTQVEDIYKYYRALADASERVKIFKLGQTFEKRDMLVIAIANPDILANIETYKDYLRALSDPRETSAEQAQEIIDKALPVYWLTGGLHSPELGPPEMLMELAYRLAVETRQPFANIRSNVITLITPVFDVDGRARQVDWYKNNIKGYTDYNNLPPRSVPFWGHYTYHDNNRDGISITQPITRNYINGIYDWRPTLSLDLHESVPLLYVAGGTGPYNPEISPITIAEWQILSNYEISRTAAQGLKGVWTWGFYTGWYPGYMLWATNNHNGNGRFYETFGNGSAETMDRDLSKSKFAGKDVTSKQWYRNSPPPKKLSWSMRNNTNYSETGVIASLEMASTNGRMFLSNYYQKGVDAIKSGSSEAPYAFLIPQAQADPDSANYMIGALGRHAIEVSRASKAAKYGDIEVAKGDLLVILNQPYAPLARNLMENQEFPKDVEVPPYDDVSWTFGLVYGVDVKAIDDEAVLNQQVEPFIQDQDTFIASTQLPSSGGYWVIPNHAQRELGPARFALGNILVKVAEQDFKVARTTYPAGSLILDMNNLDADAVSKVLKDTHLVVERIGKLPDVATHEMDLPRLGVFQTWMSTQNAGWVRYSLDEAKVPYTLFSKERAKNGDLRADFDVILIPHLWSSTELGDILGGIDTKWSPLPYETTPETPNLGHILSSPDITGGLGFDGMAAFQKFVQDGGTVVSLGSSGVMMTESGIVRGVNTISAGGMNTPGSSMTAKITQTDSPLVYGYDEITHVFRGNGPIYSLADYNRQYSPLQFGVKALDSSEDGKDEAGQDKGGKHEKADAETKKKDPPLIISGGIVKGEKTIDGQPAMVSKSVDNGQVVLFSWNPMHRHVNLHDHAFVYNAILNWNDLRTEQ